MNLILTGEDGLTLFALNNIQDPIILENMGLKTLEDIWYRPSFGRKPGVHRVPQADGLSGYGESDALLLGQDFYDSTKKRVVFIESKMGSKFGPSLSKDLRYQFFLKIAFILALESGAVSLNLSSTGNNLYRHYWTDFEGNVNSQSLNSHGGELLPVGTLLKSLYNNCVPENKNRRNGWLLLENSPSAPILSVITDAIQNNWKFSLFGLAFKKTSGNGFSLNIENVSDGSPKIYKSTFFKDNSYQQLSEQIRRKITSHFGFDITCPNPTVKSLAFFYSDKVHFELGS